MRRKLAAWALALAVLVSVLPPGLAAERSATFVIEAPETLPAVGETFEVTLRLENNPGFNSIQFSLVFDDRALTCTQIKRGTMFADAVSAVNPDDLGRASLTAACLDAITIDDVIATFTIQVDQTTQAPNFHLERTMIGTRKTAELPFEVVLRTAGGTTTKPSTPSGGGVVSPKPTDKPDSKPEDKPDAKPETPAFTDLNGHWGKDFAEKAAQAGLFKGYEDGTFRPDEPVSRAQFVTVLWRLAGTPAEERDVPFTDTAGQYIDFQKAIAWGYHQGYVKGTSEETFSPNNTLTRQEAMTILHRYSGGQSGMELMFTSIYDGQFADSGDIAPWAKSAMYWGVYHELIQGTGGGNLSPQGSASRVQIAKIMTQYQGNIGKEDK